ncbi:MAG: hypothetical protein KAT26_02900 [Marinosulfonomonas sp.]|nr:hypothetical protein [Marinosulfonomonas sp.]
MSFQEKNIVASLIAMSLVLAVFYPRIQGLYQSGQFNNAEGLVLLGKNGLYFFGAVIVANVVTLVLLYILHAVFTGGETLSDMVDERDKMIERRGMQIFGACVAVGIISAMLALTFSVGAVPVFFIILLSLAFGELVSGVAKLAMFRLGL